MVLLDELQNERNQLEKHIERLRARLGTGEGDKEKLQKVLKQQDATRQSLKVARQKAEEFQSELNNYNEQLQIKQSLRNTLIEEINKVN